MEVVMPPYSEEDAYQAEKLIKGILSNQISPQNVPMEDAHLLYRKDVIEAIVESMKKHGRYHFLCHFGKDLGQPFIEILKESAVDFYSKYPLNPVDIIWHLVGAAENDWYLSMVDRTLSLEVKCSVIEALGGNADNVDILIRIYKKGKAAEKRAALRALAQLNAPEAEPIFQKIIDKEKPVDLICIRESRGVAYEEYRKEKLHKGLEELMECIKKTDVDVVEVWRKYNSLREYFRYELGEEEIFLQIIRERNFPMISSHVNADLWFEYIYGDRNDLIKKLYEVEPELLGVCRALCKFTDQTEDCYEAMVSLSPIQRADFLSVLRPLEYASYMGRYHTELFSSCLFETLPEEFLNFLCDDSYLKPTADNSEERWGVLKAVNTVCSRLWLFTVNDFPSSEKNRIKNAAELFVIKVVEAGYMVEGCMDIIKQNPVIVQGREKGLITQYYYNMRFLKKNDAFQKFDEINVLSLSAKDKLQELNTLLKKICLETGKTEADLERIWMEGGSGQDFLGERPIFWLQKTIHEIEKEPDVSFKSVFTIFTRL